MSENNEEEWRIRNTGHCIYFYVTHKAPKNGLSIHHIYIHEKETS